MSLATTPSIARVRGRVEPAAYVLVLTILGLAYRATFITQGFNATDEGWLQSVGRRITLGQVPYRDFRFALPPVSIYKEALLLWVFGDAYTILVSRWVFVIEATAGSVLVYLILARFAGRLPAFLLAVPTIFFSVLFYYFSNYTYDAAILALLATFCIVSSDRPWTAAVAGALAGLAVLAKPTYAPFFLLLPLIAVAGARIRSRIGSEPHPALRGLYRHWLYFLAGGIAIHVLVFAYFAFQGGAGSYVQQGFFGVGLAGQQSIGTNIWLNLPTAFAPNELGLFVIVLALLVFSALGLFGRFGWVPTATLAIGLVYYGLWSFHGDQGFIPMAMGLLLVIDAAALVIAAIVRLPRVSETPRGAQLANSMPPTELILIALAMQYLAQFTFSGVIYSYLGAYLSVPVAIWTVYALGSQSSPRSRDLAMLHSAIFGCWLIAASANYVHSHVYFDAPRSALTAQFQTPKLQGVSSTPANVHRVDGVVGMVDRYTNPGDPILALPDFAGIYYLTDRMNATDQDWYLISGDRFTSPSQIEAAVSELQANPPKLILLQTYSEFDWSRSGDPIDWSASPLAPLHAYIVDHYMVVGVVDDIEVLAPRT